MPCRIWSAVVSLPHLELSLKSDQQMGSIVVFLSPPADRLPHGLQLPHACSTHACWANEIQVNLAIFLTCPCQNIAHLPASAFLNQCLDLHLSTCLGPDVLLIPKQMLPWNKSAMEQAHGDPKASVERAVHNRALPRLEHITQQHSLGQHDLVTEPSDQVRIAE